MLEIVVALYLITLMVGRWTLPIKQRLTKAAVAQMLLEYIANGSDIAEFFGNIDQDPIAVNYSMCVSITRK